MLSAIQTTSKETTLQEHAAAEHGSAHDTPAESPKFRHPHKVMLGLYIGAFLGMLSETSLNNAYSTLMEEFSISASVVQCLTTGYLLLLSVSIPSSPFMVRKFATKTLFIMAIAIFTAGTVLGALALLPGAVLGAVSATVVGGMLKRHSVSDHCGSAAAGRVACHMAGGSPDQRPAHR